MDDHEFLKRALRDGFTIRLEGGRLVLTKDSKEMYKKEGADYADFLRYFEESSQDHFTKSRSNNDLYPGPLSNHPKGMIMRPEDFDRDYETVIDNDVDINVPPLARYDPILPGDKRKNDKKKRSGDPDPDHLRKPGNGDYFM